MINARHVSVLRPDSLGNYNTLMDYMNRRKVVRLPFVDSQVVTVTGKSYVKIGATETGAGTITVMKASPPTTAITPGAVTAAELAGALGAGDAGAITSYSDALGNKLNLILLRDATSHDEIRTAADRTVFGLIQCANGTVEGVAIGASGGSENLQISFVYVAADGTITLTEVTGTIEFCLNKMYTECHIPTIYLEGGNADILVVEPKVQEPLSRALTVTAAFAANEVITLSTGAGAAAGTSTPAGDTVVLDSSEARFNANNGVRIRLNGVQLIRDVEAHWDSTTTLHITSAMDIGDVLEIEVPIKY
jgi:hypothetical protein